MKGIQSFLNISLYEKIKICIMQDNTKKWGENYRGLLDYQDSSLLYHLKKIVTTCGIVSAMGKICVCLILNLAEVKITFHTERITSQILP